MADLEDLRATKHRKEVNTKGVIMESAKWEEMME